MPDSSHVGVGGVHRDLGGRVARRRRCAGGRRLLGGAAGQARCPPAAAAAAATPAFAVRRRDVHVVDLSDVVAALRLAGRIGAVTGSRRRGGAGLRACASGAGTARARRRGRPASRRTAARSASGVTLKMPWMTSPYQDDQSNQELMSKACGQAGQPADGLQRADAVGQDAGGDDDQEHAGVREELRQVDPHRADVHPVGDRDGDQHADDQADQRPRGFGLGVADHEQRRLDALAADGEERQRRTRQARPVSSALRHVAAQLTGDGRGGLLHPQHHGRHDRDGDQRRDAGDGLGGQARDGVLAVLDHQEDADGHDDRGRDARARPT